MEHKEITIGFVTDNKRKVRTFQTFLPEWNIVQVKPLVEEKLAASTIFSYHNYHGRTSEAKAFSDMGAVHAFAAGILGAIEWWIEHGRTEMASNHGWHVALYSDCVRYVSGIEKPFQKANTVTEAVKQAMDQSGRSVDISVGLTGILLADFFPHVSVGIVTRVHMRTFTEGDVRGFIDQFGPDRVMEVSGVLPIAEGAGFFDQNRPLQVFFYPDVLSSPTLIAEQPTWNHLSEQALHQYHVGAFPGPVNHLLSKFTTR